MLRAKRHIPAPIVTHPVSAKVLYRWLEDCVADGPCDWRTLATLAIDAFPRHTINADIVTCAIADLVSSRRLIRVGDKLEVR